MFTFNLASQCPKFLQKTLRFLSFRRFPVPFVIKLYSLYPFAGNRVRDDYRTCLIYRFGLFYRINKCLDVVPINLKYVPSKGFIFLAEWLERHCFFRHPIDLNIISIYNAR